MLAVKRRKMTSHLQGGQEGHEEDRTQGEQERAAADELKYVLISVL